VGRVPVSDVGYSSHARRWNLRVCGRAADLSCCVQRCVPPHHHQRLVFHGGEGCAAWALCGARSSGGILSLTRSWRIPWAPTTPCSPLYGFRSPSPQLGHCWCVVRMRLVRRLRVWGISLESTCVRGRVADLSCCVQRCVPPHHHQRLVFHGGACWLFIPWPLRCSYRRTFLLVVCRSLPPCAALRQLHRGRKRRLAPLNTAREQITWSSFHNGVRRPHTSKPCARYLAQGIGAISLAPCTLGGARLILFHCQGQLAALQHVVTIALC
jgi:hypothetical protein